MTLLDHLDHPVTWDARTESALVDQLRRLIVVAGLERERDCEYETVEDDEFGFVTVCKQRCGNT